MMTTKKRVEVHVEKEETKAENNNTLQKTENTSKDSVTPQENDTDKEEKKEAVDPIKEREAKLESLEQEVKKTHDRFLRVSAEFENYKKRAAREMEDFRKFANESFVKAVLPVVDNLDRAIESSSNDEHANRSVVEGVNMTLKEILKVFEQFSVKPFESLGETFDPSFHQAMYQEETTGHPDNTVIRELQKGYMMHDRLLRPAMVVVSKIKDTPEDQEIKTQDKIEKDI